MTVRFVLKFILILLLWLPAMPSMAAAPDDISVIVNREVKIRQASVETVRIVFSMRLRAWDDGTPIKVFVLADEEPTHIRFCKKILGMFPYQLRWAWDRLVFSGTGQAPIKVSSEDAMKRKVAATPGAIGYVKRSYLDEQVQELHVK